MQQHRVEGDLDMSPCPQPPGMWWSPPNPPLPAGAEPHLRESSADVRQVCWGWWHNAWAQARSSRQHVHDRNTSSGSGGATSPGTARQRRQGAAWPLLRHWDHQGMGGILGRVLASGAKEQRKILVTSLSLSKFHHGDHLSFISPLRRSNSIGLQLLSVCSSQKELL